MHQIDDMPLFEKWALCAQFVGKELWVGSMAGEIVALDLDLRELRRWQAHEGSVNGILSNGITYGGDGLVKDRQGKILAGPFKKPVSKVQYLGDRLYVGTYERALYINGKKHPKIAAWHVLDAGGLLTTPQIGSKAGDLGPVELDGKELAPPAWSLSAGSTPKTFNAYFKGGRFGEVDLEGEITFLPWNDSQGPPCVVRSDDLTFFIGNHIIRAIHNGEVIGEIKLKTKGLYGSILLPNGCLAIASADGNLKVIDVAA